jgi:hypothetical protein
MQIELTFIATYQIMPILTQIQESKPSGRLEIPYLVSPFIDAYPHLYQRLYKTTTNLHFTYT